MDIEFDLQEMLLRANENIKSFHKLKSKRTIIQYSLDGIFICKYDSMSEAQISGIDIASISRICNRKQKPTKYVFKYDTDEEKKLKEPLNNLLDFL